MILRFQVLEYEKRPKVIDFEEDLNYFKSMKEYFERKYPSAKVTIINKKDKIIIT